VPAGRVIAFDDLIHGPQRFSSDDIGDFVIRRADGSVAFFLGNALDDAAMEVTVVLRGDDHLANTPRQILLLEALGLPLPDYGHLPLLLGPGGAPLSKRDGAASLHDLRLQGYLPGALRNYLVRLGHACVREGWLETDAMAVDLDLGRASRSAAHFDEAQLRHWQREAVGQATEADLEAWLEPRLDRLGSRERQLAFLAAVRGNLLFPADADALVAMVCDAQVAPDADAAREIASAGPAFFAQAAAASAASTTDFKSWTRAVGAETGRRGAGLFMPLRAALTGRIHGPELAPLAALMGPERVAERLIAAGEMAPAA
jgi:glutamyl-tRNA synthetase